MMALAELRTVALLLITCEFTDHFSNNEKITH